MAHSGGMVAVRDGVLAHRVGDDRVVVRVVGVTVPLSATELGMLVDLARDAIVGGDGCGQWRASHARWDGQQWCCPVCGTVLSFPF